MGFADNCGRHVAMTAGNDLVAFLFLDFDLGFEDLESGFDEVALTHHALVEHLEFHGVGLKYRLPRTGQ